MDNPFSVIIPRDNDYLINEDDLKKIYEKIREKIKERKLIILVGDYGSGKSIYLKRLFKRLKTKKEILYFTDAIVPILENKVPVKNKTIFIDDFDLMQGLGEKQRERLTEAMLKLISSGMIIIIACRKDTLKALFETNPLLRSKSQHYKIPKLTFDEVKKLVIHRLNMARSTETSSIEPFTEKELRMIYHKSGGNPRLVLMLLSPLYEQRMMMRE